MQPRPSLGDVKPSMKPETFDFQSIVQGGIEVQRRQASTALNSTPTENAVSFFFLEKPEIFDRPCI